MEACGRSCCPSTHSKIRTQSAVAATFSSTQHTHSAKSEQWNSFFSDWRKTNPIQEKKKNGSVLKTFIGKKRITQSFHYSIPLCYASSSVTLNNRMTSVSATGISSAVSSVLPSSDDSRKELWTTVTEFSSSASNAAAVDGTGTPSTRK